MYLSVSVCCLHLVPLPHIFPHRTPAGSCAFFDVESVIFDLTDWNGWPNWVAWTSLEPKKKKRTELKMVWEWHRWESKWKFHVYGDVEWWQAFSNKNHKPLNYIFVLFSRLMFSMVRLERLSYSYVTVIMLYVLNLEDQTFIVQLCHTKKGFCKLFTKYIQHWFLTHLKSFPYLRFWWLNIILLC